MFGQSAPRSSPRWVLTVVQEQQCLTAPVPFSLVLILVLAIVLIRALVLLLSFGTLVSEMTFLITNPTAILVVLIVVRLGSTLTWVVVVVPLVVTIVEPALLIEMTVILSKMHGVQLHVVISMSIGVVLSHTLSTSS